MPPDLSRYFTNMDRSVYALKNLPEEVVAYLFARYSRSTLSLRDDLRNMIEAEDLGALLGSPAEAETGQDGVGLAALQERARAFAEKYVLGYGHASVAEHACVHLALEDVSILASKAIEDARLASYTEKSTRYVAFDPGRVYRPAALQHDPLLAREYEETICALLEAYTGWMDDVVAQVRARAPRGEKQTQRAYEAASRATAFDILRYLLPTATFTNIGLTLNARSLETLISKLLSQPLPESRHLGERIKAEAQVILPTLLKYAHHSAYREETEAGIAALTAELFPDMAPGAAPSGVSLVTEDNDADDRLVAAILYGATPLPMDDLLARVRALTWTAKERVVDEYLSRRGRHDAPGRALERIGCTLEMTMDYGAYRDVQRHRMATQTTQPLTPGLGWEMPPDLAAFGYEDRYRALMARAAAGYERLEEAGLGREAAYLLPLATRVRTLFTWNLRALIHFVELRSARQGHPSYRRIAQQVYHAVAARYPLVARFMRPNLHDYTLTRD